MSLTGLAQGQAPEAKAPAAFSKGLEAVNAGRWAETIDHMTIVLNGEAEEAYRLQALVAVSRAERALGREKAADGRCVEVDKRFAQLSVAQQQKLWLETRAAVTEARFCMAEALLRTLSPLEGQDLTQIAPAMQKRIMGVTELAQLYQKVLLLEDPHWSVAAMVRLGQIYVALADEVQAVPAPKGLQPEQQKIFTEQLAKSMRPMREQGKVFFEKAVTHAEEKQIDGEWVSLAKKSVAALKANTPVPSFKAPKNAPLKMPHR
ncbi:MAG: hypothetical protein ACE366_18395 [Bradymonadia bacterium]